MGRRSFLLLYTVCAALAATPQARAGYTHYFTWRQPPDEARLKACIKDLARVSAAANDLLAGLEGTGAPVVESLRIQFNGREPEDSEPFVFPGNPGFNFCKTLAKPYDAVVTACLLVARDHFPPGMLEISSDGDWQDWIEGARLYQKVFGRPALNPLNASAPPALRIDAEEGQSQVGPALFLIGSAVAGLAVLYWASRPRYLLVVSIEGGAARVSQGHVKPVIIDEIGDICARNGITRGTIWGIRDKKRVRLSFSRDLPHRCCQQIRNVWALHASVGPANPP